VVEAIVAGHGLSGCGSAVGFPARSNSPMLYGSSSAAGDVRAARAGSRIIRTMEPSAVRGETSGSRPKRHSSIRRSVRDGEAEVIGGRGVPRVSMAIGFSPVVAT
jgi:hypothetical protein